LGSLPKAEQKQFGNLSLIKLFEKGFLKYFSLAQSLAFRINEISEWANETHSHTHTHAQTKVIGDFNCFAETDVGSVSEAKIP